MASVENLTRVYTINLGRAWLTPQHKRTDRVVNMIREFAEKHMKSSDVKLEQELNRQVWLRGKTNPPRKVRVKMVKDEDGVVTVSLYEDTAETPVEETKPETATEAPAAAEQPKPEEPKAEEKPAAADK
jgi:large subunit ribosomal protein L31e